MMHDADDRIERLIDRAASSLTDAPDAPAFTARVMARLDAPASARPVARWMRHLVPAAACALLLVTAVGWWQRRSVHDAPASAPGAQFPASRALPTAAVVVPAAGTATPSGPSPTRLASARPQHAARAAAVEAARVPRYEVITIDTLAITAVGGDDAGVVLDPLLDPSPIAVERLAIDPIDSARASRSEPPQSPGGRQ